MIDPKQVLAAADRWVLENHLYAAPPSSDPAIVALAGALVSAANAELAQFAAGVIEVLSLHDEPQAFNYAVHELAKLLGAVQPPAAPPSSGPSPGT